jgi:5-methylcytosine-specific restriction endonuclease McrA
MPYPKHSKPRKKPIKIHKIIRESVIDRDYGTCQICGARAEQVHHILYKSYGGNDSAYNLVCLCNKDHLMVHSDGKKWYKILFAKQKVHYPQLKKQDLRR